jgi:sigma-B regulation protein RsbU (phosphoserine phosphatase)
MSRPPREPEAGEVTAPAGSEQLRNLLAVTGTALARLDVEDLLSELLGGIRAVLDADTAAVLLRDAGSDELVARAACGLEEEVRQGVRVPVGTGFAGSIAKRKCPVVLNRVDPTTVANPILWEKGIQKMLGVPLLSGDDVIGVLHVGRLDDRPFTDTDADLLQVAAERVASATHAQQLAIESTAARLLERGLQPGRLPRLPGVQLAARYVTAENRLIGGDWYDAFTVPSGPLWLVVGDVAGHGLNAAVVMGRAKSALRAYALVCDTPQEALERTDRKVQHFEIGTLITVVCVVSAPPYDRFDICSAGHPPPVLAVPGQDAEFVDIPPAPPLGAVPDLARTATSIEMPDGATVVLYTDGLVEDPNQPIDHGLRKLRSAVRTDDPAIVCQTVMHHLIGNRPPTDDIALLAIRRANSRTGTQGHAPTGGDSC